MDLEEFLAQVDLHDPNVLRQLPSSLIARVRPDLLWTCANCLCRQPTAEYMAIVRGDEIGGGGGGERPDSCDECGVQRIVRAPAGSGQEGGEEEPDLAKLITCQPCGGGGGGGGAAAAAASGTAVVYDPRMLAHAKEERGSVHPERPDRLRAIRQHLEAVGLWQRCEAMAARQATLAELELVHTAAHCRTVKEHCEQAKDFRSDTYAVEASYEAALLSCGSVVSMAVAVAEGRHRNGFAVVRPPGHHAEPPHGLRSAAALAPPRGADELIATGKMPWANTCCGAMGFCLFNNVAVAARAAQREVAGCNKVLIVDWDVHHGNGTQTPFYDDPTVLYFSAHRFDEGQFYPGGPEGGPERVGVGAGAGYNVNIGWPHGGMGDAEYVAAWHSVLLPIATQFQPDLVLVSAGFDAADGDPLGGCAISPGGYALLTSMLMGLAGGKLAMALEGGYNLRSISQSSAACVATMLGDPVAPALSLRCPAPEHSPLTFDRAEAEPPEGAAAGASREEPGNGLGRVALGPAKGARWAIRKAISAHAKYWTSLCALAEDDELNLDGGEYGESSSDSESETGSGADAGGGDEVGAARGETAGLGGLGDDGGDGGPGGGGQAEQLGDHEQEQLGDHEQDEEQEQEEAEEHIVVHGRAGKRPRTEGHDSEDGAAAPDR